MNQTTSLQLRGDNKKTPFEWRFSCNEIKKQNGLRLFQFRKKAEIKCSYRVHNGKLKKKKQFKSLL